ncbi:MAG: hypothetical protein ABGZ23_24945 [Fuerstiella sp.]
MLRSHLKDATLANLFNRADGNVVGEVSVGAVDQKVAALGETRHLACPCGGKYELSKDGRHGVCSHHGHADLLVPCCEIPESKVTVAEAQAYKTFVGEYSQYWRTFFDPIAIRVLATDDRYRLETIVLPLINNSLYQSLAMALGGEPKPLRSSVTDDTAMSLSLSFAKDRLLQRSGWRPPVEHACSSTGSLF